VAARAVAAAGRREVPEHRWRVAIAGPGRGPGLDGRERQRERGRVRVRCELVKRK
jgi:hypothetical protein